MYRMNQSCDFFDTPEKGHPLISSKKNPKVERWKKLQSKRSFRRDEKRVLIEGRNAIYDILCKYPERACHLLVREDREKDIFSLFPVISCPYTCLSFPVFEEISEVENSDGFILECFLEYHDQESLRHFLSKNTRPKKLVILDRLQDPGNVGTLIRTALAFHIDAIITIEPTCDLWNPKVLRSGKGAHFQLPFFESSWQEIEMLFQEIAPQKRPALIAAFPPGDNVLDIGYFMEQYSNRICSSGWALILGNEAHGVTIPDTLSTHKITIPINEKIESLNVAQAGAILVYLLSQCAIKVVLP